MVSSVENVSGRSYDYVVIGGGVSTPLSVPRCPRYTNLNAQTAGLTAASRLVEYFPDRSVLVLEAGEANLDDPKIMLGGQFGGTFEDPKVCRRGSLMLYLTH